MTYRVIVNANGRQAYYAGKRVEAHSKHGKSWNVDYQNPARSNTHGVYPVFTQERGDAVTFDSEIFARNVMREIGATNYQICPSSN